MNVNSFLIAALIALVVSFSGQSQAPAAPPAAKGATTSRNVSIAEAEKALKADKRILVLDVRTPDEFAEGHLPGAQNIDFYEKDFQTQLGRLDRDRTYLVYCKVGGRSAKAETAMQSLKFKSVLHLNEGFDQWQAAGKAVQK